MTLILDIKEFSKSFYLHDLNKKIDAVQNINLQVHEGEFIGITGKSGSGKSTILKGIYRTNFPDQGSIKYQSTQFGWVDLLKLEDRKVLHLRKHEIGYVSQFLRIMPRVSAIEYVKNSLRELEQDESLIHQKAVDMLRHFDLNENLWDVTPNTFSGGEKLRLNIASAMVKKPRLLLLDEPTASLDAVSKQKVRELLQKLKDEKTTMLGIFHDLEFMEALVDREYHIEVNSNA